MIVFFANNYLGPNINWLIDEIFLNKNGRPTFWYEPRNSIFSEGLAIDVWRPFLPNLTIWNAGVEISDQTFEWLFIINN